ncbi:MAG: tyrosine-type recombinase/integrase [Desulfuromonadaceae bacterium]|nr:tyrosine-type recombinase/integrase [Desulfuromonadaceae bacterium]
MPKRSLTQKFVDSTTNSENQRKTDYFDEVCKGLLLEVRATGKTYYLRYRDEREKTHQRKLADAGIIPLKTARALAREKLNLLALGDDPFAERDNRKKVPTVAEFVRDSYLPHAKGYKRSWQTDESLLRNHILPAIGHLHLDQVTRRHCVDLFSHHRATHEPGSTNRIIILCRYIFNCAIRWEVPCITQNPTSGIDLFQENNQRERYLSEEEARRLFDALEQSESKHLKYIISMLLLTGARKNEVLNAKWTDIDMERRLWRIEFNKSGKTRYVPLSDGMLQLLQSLPRSEEDVYLFPSPKSGGPYVQIFSSWDKARERAGLLDLRIHDLRHSFASMLINSGRSLYEVQKLLGHTQVKTTQRYSHLSQESLIAAANTATAALPLDRILPVAATQVPLLSVDLRAA